MIKNLDELQYKRLYKLMKAIGLSDYAYYNLILNNVIAGIELKQTEMDSTKHK